MLCNGGGLANHDTGYVYSDDRGRTWRNNAGAAGGHHRLAAPWSSVGSPGHVVDPLDVDHALINQESQAVDSTGNPHVDDQLRAGPVHPVRVATSSPAAHQFGRAFHLRRDARAAGARWRFRWRSTRSAAPRSSSTRPTTPTSCCRSAASSRRARPAAGRTGRCASTARASTPSARWSWTAAGCARRRAVDALPAALQRDHAVADPGRRLPAGLRWRAVLCRAMSDETLITSLAAAVESRPDDLPLRLHLAGLLVDAGRAAEAIAHAAQVLARDPGNAEAQSLMQRALFPVPPRPTEPAPAAGGHGRRRPTGRVRAGAVRARAAAFHGRRRHPRPPRGDEPDPVAGDDDRIVRRRDAPRVAARRRRRHGRRQEAPGAGLPRPAAQPRSCARCTARACAAACCSTARPAAARRSWPGRSPARWAPSSSRCRSSTCSNMWIGNSERNLHEIFETARRNAPCVLFLDEIDALGHKRSQLQPPAACARSATSCSPSWTAWRATTTACSCWPPPTRRGTSTRRCAGPAGWTAPCWCCRRTPSARAAILEYHLRDRPIAGIDLRRARRGHRRLLRRRPGAPVRDRGRVRDARLAAPAARSA